MDAEGTGAAPAVPEGIEEDPGPGLRRRFEALYGDHFADIYRYVTRRARPSDVHDLVANVFLAAWRRMADVPDAPEDLLWLYGVARRVVAHQVRTEGRRQRLVSKLQRHLGHGDVPVEAPSLTLSDEVSLALQVLRPDARELVRLIVWEQLSHSEAAVVLGCSANAVAIRWHRALKRLRRELGVSAGTASEPARCAPPPIAGEHR